MNLYRCRKINLVGIADFLEDSIWASHLVCQFSTWSNRLPVFHGDPDHISFVKINFSTLLICLFLLSFLRFLHVLSCRLPGIMHAFCQLLRLFSIYALSGIGRCRWWSPVEGSARCIPKFNVEWSQACRIVRKSCLSKIHNR